MRSRGGILLLATIGVYGVVSMGVNDQIGEIGIRMSLGAQPRDILRMVMGRGMILAGAGTAVGLVAAFWLMRFLSSLLFGIGTADPVTYLFVAALLLFTAVLACANPARRASHVDPMRTLRCE